MGYLKTLGIFYAGFFTGIFFTALIVGRGER
jgi:hypothetical protein